MTEAGESVRVVIRLRPEERTTSANGKDLGGSCIIALQDKKLTIADVGRTRDRGVDGSRGRGGESGRGGSDGGGNDQRQQGHDFTFDRVFGPDASQRDVFDSVEPLVHATVDGFTTTVFAYGSTGSGKTHTISGTEDDLGVLPRAVSLLFERLESDAKSGKDKAFMVFVTYVEIYNNIFHNLLGAVEGSPSPPPASATKWSKQHRRPDTPHASSPPPPPPPTTKIEVREHPSRGVFLSGGRDIRVPVRSASAVTKLVAHGTKARRTAATGLNARSSRSHAILILEIEASHEYPSGSSSVAQGPEGQRSRRSRRASIADCVSIGKMQLIDLAGSERVSMSGVKGSSLVEAQNINLSLTLLGDVLNALSKYHRSTARTSLADADSAVDRGGASRGQDSSERDRPFVPYRNSKLTHLLKDSLGGNCKTLMICAIRAAPACFQQTMMSLRYAARARDIKNVPHRVLEGASAGGGHAGASLRSTVDEIDALRSRLAETTVEFQRLRGATAHGEAEKQALRQQLQALADRNRAEKGRMDELLQGVIHSQKGELERRKAEYVDLQETMDLHATTIEEQKERIKDLQTEREEASSAASTAKEQVAELHQALFNAEQIAAQLREELSSLKATGELMRFEREELSSKVGVLEEAAKHREAAAKAAHVEMETYRRAVKKMAKERERTNAAAAGAIAKHEQAADALREMEHEEKRTAATREETYRLKEATLKENLKTAEDAAAALRADTLELQTSLSLQSASLEDALHSKADAERQRDQVRAAADELGVRMSQVCEERERANASLAEASASASRAAKSLCEEAKEATRAKEELVAAREQLATCQARLAQEEEQVDLHREQKQEAQSRRDAAEALNARLAAAHDGEVERRSKAEAQAHDSEQSVASLTTECQALRSRVASSAEETVALRDALTQETCTTKSLRSQLDEAGTSASQKAAAAAAKHAREVEALLERLNVQDQKACEFQIHADAMAAECGRLRGQLVVRDRESTASHGRVDELVGKVDEASALAQEREREAIDLQHKLTQNALERTTLRESLEGRTRELDALRMQHASEIEEVRREAENERKKEGEEWSRRLALEMEQASSRHRRELDLCTTDAAAAAAQSTELALRQGFQENLQRAVETAEKSSRQALEKQRETHLRDVAEADHAWRTHEEKKAQELRKALRLELEEASSVAEERAKDRETRARVEGSRVATEAAASELRALQDKADAIEQDLRQKVQAVEDERERLKDELTRVARQAKELEQGNREREERASERVQRSEDTLAAAEMRADVLEEQLATVARERQEALLALKNAKAAATQAAESLKSEASDAERRVQQELDSSRAELASLRGELEASREISEKVRKTEIDTRQELTHQRESWRQATEQLNQRLDDARNEREYASERHAEELMAAEAMMQAERDKYLSEKHEAAAREAALVERGKALEGVTASLRKDLQDTVAEMDEAESSARKRGEGLGQRVVSLGAELRETKAESAKLRVALETGKLELEDRDAEIATLKARAAASAHENHALAMDVPNLRARLREKEAQNRDLLGSKREADVRLREEVSKTRGLEREAERLRTALHRTITTVQQHITSSAPNSPAAMLAADPSLRSVAAVYGGGDGSQAGSEYGRRSGRASLFRYGISSANSEGPSASDAGWGIARFGQADCKGSSSSCVGARASEESFGSVGGGETGVKGVVIRANDARTTPCTQPIGNIEVKSDASGGKGVEGDVADAVEADATFTPKAG